MVVGILSKLFHYYKYLEFDKHFIDYFDRKDIDGWELRKGIYFL